MYKINSTICDIFLEFFPFFLPPIASPFFSYTLLFMKLFFFVVFLALKQLFFSFVKYKTKQFIAVTFKSEYSLHLRYLSWVWWCMFGISGLGKWMQDHEFKASLSYIVKTCLKLYK